ncbi:hypothetical protein ACROYT_G035638 [Oculina patagonica]
MSQNRNSQITEFVDFIREGNLEGVQRILLENGNNDESNPLLKKKFGQFKETALHLAVKYGHEEIVKLLLENGADIHATNLHLCTVLHTATDGTEGINIIMLILRCNGVNVNARDGYGNTPVKLAAEKGNSDAVRLLMQNGADVTIADNGENTTLHVAAKKGHVQVLEMLLQKLVNTGIIGKQNKDKNTPLHLAVERQNRQGVAMLLNFGAASTMDVKNENGQTTVDLAKDHEDKVIIDFLKDPKKAKEWFQEKPKPLCNPLQLFQEKPKQAKTASRPAQLARGFSVEADSSANNPSYQMTLSWPQELMQHLPQNIHVNANQVIINQQYSTTVNGGEVAVGPGNQVVNVQDPTAIARSWAPHALSGESHYEVNVTGGNASVGDYSVINVSTGTPRTPTNASASFPVRGESPMDKLDTSLPHQPAQEEKPPTDKLNASMARLTPEEKSLTDKSNASLPHMIQEEPLTEKANMSPLYSVPELFQKKVNAPNSSSAQQGRGGSVAVEANSCQATGNVTSPHQFITASRENVAIPRGSDVVTAQPSLSVVPIAVAFLFVVVPPEVLTRGPIALEVYKNALAEGETCVKRVPLMLIGQNQAGKTSTKKSLKGISFNPKEDSTVGIDVDPSHFKLSNEIWKAGEKNQEANAEKAISFEHKTARLIVDTLKEEKKATEKKRRHVTSGRSYDSPTYDSAINDMPTSRELPQLPLSESSKGPDQSQTFKDQARWTREDFDVFTPPEQEFEEIAALAERLLQDDGLENGDVYSVLWDFAGQSVYYVTHVLFLTARAIYFLVYDLSQNPHERAKPLVKQGWYKKFQDMSDLKTNLDYLDLWMTSVASLASQDEDDIGPKAELLPKKLPAVFLVCTHADTPHGGGDPHEMANEIFGFLKKKPYGSHLHDVFCVNNTKSGSESECPEVMRLREEVLAVSNELPYINEAIPIKWLKYEKALQKLGKKWISFDSAKHIASKVCEINGDEEIRTLLNFLHDMRILIHFDDTPELDNLVILDPQWLIDVFKKVITVRPYHWKEKKFEDLWCKLEREGILEENLVKHVWGNLNHQKGTVGSLIAIMEKFGLLCPLPSSDGLNSKQYLVPSMLKSHPTEAIMKLTASAQTPSLFIRFDSGQVPPGLFSGMVLQFYQWGKEEVLTGNPKLYHNFARFFMSGDQLVLSQLSVPFLIH